MTSAGGLTRTPPRLLALEDNWIEGQDMGRSALSLARSQTGEEPLA